LFFLDSIASFQVNPFARRELFYPYRIFKVTHIEIFNKKHIIHKEKTFGANTESNNVIRLSRNELFEDCLINENLSENIS